MKSFPLSVAFVASVGLSLALGTWSWAVNVDFIVDNGDFNVGSSWSDGNVPSLDFESYFVQDDLTARFLGGDTTVFTLTIGDTSLGRLNMSGGTLTVVGRDQFEVGEGVGGEGQVMLTGTSLVTAAGAVVGTRSKGQLTVGPDATFDLSEDGMTRDLRVGSYGPAFVPIGPFEPGLDGDGLVDVQGTLNAATLILSQSGAKGEFRNSGGTVNLAGSVFMELCELCGTNPVLLAQRSAKLSMVGSTGSFHVSGEIRAISPTAIFSFTADAGGVTTIFADNGSTEIDSAQLELNLDAFPFTPTSRLTLIDAFDSPGLLFGEFSSVTFLGNTTADVNYDLFNNDVYLDNFQRTVANCDLNNDNLCNTLDVRVLYNDISSGTLGGPSDLDGNGVVNNNDIDDWLSAAGTLNGRIYVAGDADLNGAVGGNDFTALAANFGRSGLPNAYWDQGNFDGNAGGAFGVGGSDFTALAANFGHVSVSVVPEPGAAGMLLLAVVGLARLRRSPK